ncbi:tetratricopeptide repeat protein [Hoeflea alexandrii]|uniref:tetratricopeptide repeat protein n=1 Tax=Hoeflea alexandrii TaxID=288436 RepID=UPI0022708210|nr:tetratricopeptide repeat protein [Hoeflea alexandrii]MCY0154995.1 sel1 repeat family protein [Hoeflea alexandrii]
MNSNILGENEGGLYNGNNRSVSYCAEKTCLQTASAAALPADGQINHTSPATDAMDDDINRAAECGDMGAQIELAYSSLNANGKPSDYAEAFRWYRKAADLGNCHAQFSIGFMYLEGLGTRRDYNEAFHWFFLAAEQGDTSAQANLGWLYENGFGAPEDDAEAVRWYRKAALNEDPYAALSLGLMYSRGCCPPTDPDAAYIWISIAAWNGVPEAEDEQEKLEKTMTPGQISMAWRRAKVCISSGYKDCACI